MYKLSTHYEGKPITYYWSVGSFSLNGAMQIELVGECRERNFVVSVGYRAVRLGTIISTDIDFLNELIRQSKKFGFTPSKEITQVWSCV